jgi:hypothetical protein
VTAAGSLASGSPQVNCLVSCLTDSAVPRAHNLPMFWKCIVASILVVSSVAVAQAASSVRVVETHPAAGSALGPNEPLWVHVEYTTDEPISLWARPFRNDEQVTNALSNASPTYSGAGSALGWFSLVEPGDIDEVRIIAGGGKPYLEWELGRYPLDVRWTAAPSSGQSRPQWVDELLAVEKARQEEEAKRRAAEPVSAAEVSLFNGFMLIILALAVAGIGVPLWSVWKWRGGWRIAASLPAVAVGFVVLRIIFDTARDPTSHNLWPFEIVMAGGAALLCIGALRVARRFVG